MSENFKYIPFKWWWIVGTAVAVVTAFMSYHVIGGPVTPTGVPRWCAVLVDVGAVEAVVFIGWFAADDAGDKGVRIPPQ